MQSSLPSRLLLTFAPVTLVFSALAGASCSSSSGGQPDAGPSTTAAAVSGPADTHCGSGSSMTVQTIGVCLTNDAPSNAAACGVTFQPDTTSDDAGAAPDDGGTDMSDYGATLYNATGYDDDCKYQVSWTATPVAVNTNVTFTVTATRLEDNQPAHCANIVVEAFNDNTPAIPPPAATETGSSGVYTVGPIQFPVSGMWTVRFHLYEECNDTPDDSPHGHAAFYVNVP